jgi:hypothetical protein
MEERILKPLKIQLKTYRIFLLLGAVFSVLLYQPAFAHGGVDHSKSCYLTAGDTRLQMSGYQFQPELEGKHFCHFFPELGQIVLVVEPVAEGQEKTAVTLELAALSSGAFTVIKQMPARLMGDGLVSITQTIEQRGVYRLNVTVQKASGEPVQQHFLFLVGIPVTKILVMIAGLLALLLAFVGVRKAIS